MIATKLSRLKLSSRRAMLVMQGFILALTGIAPLVLTHAASATSLQLTNRSVTSSTGKVSTVTDLVFAFHTTTKGSTNIKQIELEFCDSPLGACLITHTPTLSNTPTATLGGTFAGSGVTTTRENSRTTPASTNTQFKIVITTPGDEDNKNLVVNVTGSVTNYSGVNSSYYPRIRAYSDTGTTEEWYGAVAQSTSQTLTVNARVQEVLQFCVGTTAVDSSSAQIVNNAAGNVTSCAAADGTSVDLGVVTNGTINTTPVDVVNQGDDKLAYAMVQTNAQNGVVIGYRAVQDTSSGKLKVVGATCSGTATTDQCFNSQGSSDGAFTAGTENFGMTIAGVNCANVGSNYTCNYTATGSNLCLKAEYDQQTSNCGVSRTYVATNDLNSAGTTYAWVDTGSSITNIAGSDASTLKVVANEALMLKFAATSQITTPTGLYQAQADFVATPTF